MTNANFYTLTSNDDGDLMLEPHKSLEEAEFFASDTANEGRDCAVIQILSVARKEYVHRAPPEKLYGVKPGVDFPGSFCGGSA